MPFSPALLVTVNGFDRGIDINGDAAIGRSTLPPRLFSQSLHDFPRWPPLINAQAVQVTLIGAGNRQTFYAEDAAKHGLQTNVNKMPNPVKPDKH